uniref:Uroporphyrinogen-III synthase n=1 Tax=Lotharella globosa TaxID=91324 RepID=A0A7S3Z567_9EUKA|mmetsp:Transcript_12237/g.24699  ORF Transcript_12237/g.24699 Transcript_12237/m.24699 type:complete len:127 (+) Transcript_12237:611-991(+)
MSYCFLVQHRLRHMFLAHSKDVETLLSDRGYLVERVDAYTTLPADWTDEDSKVAANAKVVTFGSPSAVKVWAKRAPVDSPIAVCIGGTSAKACKAAGFVNIRHPEKPGVATWAEEVFRVLESIECT